VTLHHIFVQDDDADNLEFRGEAALWVPKLPMFMTPGVSVKIYGGYREQAAVIDDIIKVPVPQEYRYKVMLKRVD
jgi:hypothetical protein